MSVPAEVVHLGPFVNVTVMVDRRSLPFCPPALAASNTKYTNTMPVFFIAFSL
jgi:hypothetical protein